MPGTSQVALTSALPMQGWTDGMPLRIPSTKPGQAATEGGGGFKMVSPSYFATIGLPVVRGRGLGDTDTASSTPVIVINQAFANRYFEGVDPIGRHVIIERILPRLLRARGRGAVGDRRHRRRTSASDRSPPHESRGMYITLDQSPQFVPRVIVRTSAAAAGVMAGLKAAAIELDPNQPLTEMRTVEDISDESLGADRLRTWLVAAFSGIALLLAGIGIFGVIAYSVAQRTHEIGVRAALGASRGRVMGARHPPCAAAHGRRARTRDRRRRGGHAVHVEPAVRRATERPGQHGRGRAVARDRSALLAAWIPARRAAAVDPLVALRME